MWRGGRGGGGGVTKFVDKVVDVGMRVQTTLKKKVVNLSIRSQTTLTTYGYRYKELNHAK